MLKNISNSKLFFLALGVTVALCGMRVYAGPAQDMQNTNHELGRIATALEKMQKNGVEIKQESSGRLHITVDRMP